MSILHAIKIDQPSRENVVSEYILQQKCYKKIVNLDLEGYKFKHDEFKEIYSGAVLDMNTEKLERLSKLQTTEEIVEFLRRKGNRKKCEDLSSSSESSESSRHADQQQDA